MTKKPYRRAIACACCGIEQVTHSFAWNGKTGDYSPNCKSCGAWLFLLRKVFGPVEPKKKSPAVKEDNNPLWGMWK